MKKILIALIIVFNCFVLFGCAKVSYFVTYNANGEITQTFSVQVDKDQLEQNGYSYVDVISTINSLYSNYWMNKQQTMQNNLNGNSNLSDEEKNQAFSSVKRDIEILETEITLTITYPNSRIAKLVNTDTTKEEEEDDVKYEEHFFTRVMVQDVTNIYSGYHESELYSQLNSLYNANNEFTDEDISLTHVIAFSNNRYKSNAKRVVVSNGLYYHIWEVNSTPDKNGEYATTPMKLYITTARPVTWYGVAVVITLLFIMFSFVFVKYSKIKQKKLK